MVAAAGVAATAPVLRRRVDMFLPVSEAVRRLSGLDDSLPHRVVPNFIGELPPAPPAGEPLLARLPREPFILYFGDVTEDKGVGALLQAYRRLDSPLPLVLIGRLLLEGAAEVPGVVALGRAPHAVVVEALRRAAFSVAPSLLPESFGIVTWRRRRPAQADDRIRPRRPRRRRPRRRDRAARRARRRRGPDRCPAAAE
ncbi:MAG: hypothetical protein U0R71_08190 [Solirubrobacterales bacterium]